MEVWEVNKSWRVLSDGILRVAVLRLYRSFLHSTSVACSVLSASGCVSVRVCVSVCVCVCNNNPTVDMSVTLHGNINAIITCNHQEQAARQPGSQAARQPGSQDLFP
ncbi:GL16502 [Drosophila persimilis]|uniref:GL16502 n=1 Tax=Drosophila persimilis TaxID=7234 RepID=B4GW71_DROPE|nr:GL16502 [Drosophila persimilis]